MHVSKTTDGREQHADQLAVHFDVDATKMAAQDETNEWRPDTRDSIESFCESSVVTHHWTD